MTESKVKIICLDGEVIQVDREIARKYVLVDIMEITDEEEIELPKFHRQVVEKIFEFCDHFKDLTPPEIDQPIVSTDMSKVVDPWQAEFINLD